MAKIKMLNGFIIEKLKENPFRSAAEIRRLFNKRFEINIPNYTIEYIIRRDWNINYYILKMRYIKIFMNKIQSKKGILTINQYRKELEIRGIKISYKMLRYYLKKYKIPYNHKIYKRHSNEQYVSIPFWFFYRDELIELLIKTESKANE